MNDTLRPRRMFRIGVLLIAGLPMLSGQRLPDITAHLSLEKQQYLVGEPIFVTFSATYTGKKKFEELSDTSPYGQCGTYGLTVAGEAMPPVAPAHSCPVRLQAFHCLSGGFRLNRGVEKQQRVLLNAFHSFREPGTYSITVSHHLSHTAFGRETNRPTANISASFTVVLIAAKTQEQLAEVFAPYQRNLSSKNSDLRDEAALVISTLPTPFLETDLIEMLKHDDLEFEAAHGLRRLHSERGRAALLAVLTPGTELSFKEAVAIEALDEIGDADTGAQLRDFADKISNADDQNRILRVAAHLDPQGTLPLIDSMLSSTDDHRRQKAVWLLEETGLREAAVRILGLMKDSSPLIRNSAEQSLASLAQEAPPGNSSLFGVIQPHPDADLAFWQAWLAKNQTWPTPHMRECAQTNRDQ